MGLRDRREIEEERERCMSETAIVAMEGGDLNQSPERLIAAMGMDG